MGAIQWNSWVPFLPILVSNYYKRYTQHFSILSNYPTYSPVGRKFYEQPWMIDGGSLMYKRLLNRDKNVLILLNFGWRVIGERLIPPPTFKEFVESFFHGLQFQFDGISYDDLPIPAIQFSRKVSIGNNFEDNMFVRIGIEDAPNPEKWDLVTEDDDGLIDVPLELFAHTFGNNRPPMNVIMFDHDFSHVADNLNHPGYYKANQEAFSRIAGKHPSKSKLNVSQDPSAGNPFTTYGRICCMHEELVMPDITKVVNGYTVADLLSDLDHAPDPKTRGMMIVMGLPKFLARHGGGMNDPYNLNNDLNIRTTPKQRLDNHIQNRSRYLFSNKGRELFSQLAIESILGTVSDIEYLCNLPDFGGFHGKIVEDKCWQLQTAISKAVKLELTPTQFVQETTDQYMKPESASYKWLASFIPRYTLMSKLYLSTDAVGMQI